MNVLDVGLYQFELVYRDCFRKVVQKKGHYKIFCVNAKYGILKRVPYFFIYNFVKCQRK